MAEKRMSHADTLLNITLTEREGKSGRTKHEEADNIDNNEAPGQDSTDTVDGFQFVEDEVDSSNSLPPLNPNVYIGKRNFIHKLMDVALMMANVSQLKALLASENIQYHYILLTLICLSIGLQVIFTICMIAIWSIEKEIKELEKQDEPETISKEDCGKIQRKKWLTSWLDRTGSQFCKECRTLCGKCGPNHYKQEKCCAENARFNKCNRIGHFARVCLRAAARQKSDRSKQRDQERMTAFIKHLLALSYNLKKNKPKGKGVLFIGWTDERITWDPQDYNGTQMVYTAADTVWRPEIMVANPSVTFSLLGVDIPRRLTNHFHDGLAGWTVAKVFQCTCSIDLTSFPWDIQKCALQFTIEGYIRHEMQLVTKQTTKSLRQFEENGQWILSRTRVYTKYHPFKSILDFEIVLQRRPIFFIVNIILPILAFSILNLEAFIVPFESGERTSFSLTLLLSIGVFITLISAHLPPNAETMAFICYFLLNVMTQSTITCLLNVISMKIYFKTEDKEPSNTWRSCFVFCNSLKCCLVKKTTFSETDGSKDAQ